MKKYTLSLSLLTLTMALSSASAFAAEQAFGSPMTASADLVFVAPVGLTHNLTAATGLVSGIVDSMDPVAVGSIVASHAEPSSVLVEWVNGTQNGATSVYRSIPGVNTDGSINLMLVSDLGGVSPPEGEGRRLTPFSGTTAKVFSYHIMKSGLGQDIKPDTYPVIIRAQAYVP